MTRFAKIKRRVFAQALLRDLGRALGRVFMDGCKLVHERVQIAFVANCVHCPSGHDLYCKILNFYKNRDISKTLKFKYLELGILLGAEVWTRGTL